MKKKGISIILITLIVLLLILILRNVKNINSNELYFIYPFNGSLFPPEFPAPGFIWQDADENITEWIISISVNKPKHQFEYTVNTPFWQPSKIQWDSLKILAGNNNIDVNIKRKSANNRKIKNATAQINISFSTDSVGAPILYREIPIPFGLAEKYPDSMSFRLCNVGSENAPYYTMKKFMVCGNCHSFTADGKTMGVDFDAAHRDKGGYFLADIDDTILFNPDNYLSWAKLYGKMTFGTFSRLSPNGRYVATTVRDRVIAKNIEFGTTREIGYSQLFFPVNGVIAIYDRQTGRLWELPGANLRDYVQTSAFWDPKGENLYFARAKALPYNGDTNSLNVSDQHLVEEFYNRKRDFKYDIYTIPFNNGKGGTAVPVKGASNNGKSNYFPTVSPDGKFIIFCQAENFMLLMPDSRLYIIPIEGGKAVKLRCNRDEMHSWHSFSPNGKWLVYSCKSLSLCTDMFLTHIDEKGKSSIPVVIEKARKKGRVTNYPEFINIEPDRTFNIDYEYINISDIQRALLNKDTTEANMLYNKFIKQGQYSTYAEYIALARILKKMNRNKEAEKFFKLARNSEL